MSIYGSGKQVRDVLYVDDLVELYHLVFLSDDWPEGAVNAGGGIENSLSLLEYLALLDTHFGLPLKHRFHRARPGDQVWFVSDNAKAREAFCWEPTTGFEDGLDRLVDWSRSIS